MRLIIIYILCLIGTVSSYAQSINDYDWKPVRIPVDSLRSQYLIALDSQHIVFVAIKDSTYIHSQYGYVVYDVLHYWFESSDGGKTWESRVDTTSNLYNGSIKPYSPNFLIENISTRYVLAADSSTVLYRTTNSGHSWESLWSGKYYNQLVTSLTKNNPIIYDYNQKHLYRSTDGGLTFPYKLSDSVLHHTMWPDIIRNTEHSDCQYQIASYVKRDLLHHTFFPWRTGCINDTEKYLAAFPDGLHTLVTTTFGVSWKHYVTPIPTQKKKEDLFGVLDFTTQNDRLFFISRSFMANFFFGYYYGSGISNNRIPTSCGFNFSYSDDDGRTWTFDTTYYTRRRAFEPVLKEEVWMSITKDEMNVPGYYSPAYILTRTTDMGKSWEYDTTTLGQLFEQKADGHIITFSDPRHGWIAARIGADMFILRYDANEQPKSVEKGEAQTFFYMWLYPIPAINEVQINFLKKGTMQDVEFFDVMGRKVSVPFTMNDNTATATVKDIPSGYYIVRAKLSGTYYARPLIVRK